jgi:F0F1-type ATP synthase assembly protein I
LNGDSQNLKQALFTVSDIVLGAAVLIALGVWVGNFLDEKLNTSPWFTISLSMIGGALGLTRMVIKAMSIDKKDSSKK